MKNRLLSFMLIIAAGCNSTLEDPDSLPADKTLQLSADLTSIPSGGGGKTLVLARVPKEAGLLDITFTATAGLFREANNKTVKDLTDSLVSDYRYASAVLVSDATKGTVYITAEAKTSRVRITVTFN
ncbi:hypothetical protein WSM22_19250 [Cytophagales bacterium WSM2-2]|nr:hypothetical protein WSM22_19250 [Cytophagales bacterium WSM2-2]